MASTISPTPRRPCDLGERLQRIEQAGAGIDVADHDVADPPLGVERGLEPGRRHRLVEGQVERREGQADRARHLFQSRAVEAVVDDQETPVARHERAERRLVGGVAGALERHALVHALAVRHADDGRTQLGGHRQKIRLVRAEVAQHRVPGPGAGGHRPGRQENRLRCVHARLMRSTVPGSSQPPGGLAIGAPTRPHRLERRRPPLREVCDRRFRSLVLRGWVRRCVPGRRRWRRSGIVGPPVGAWSRSPSHAACSWRAPRPDRRRTGPPGAWQSRALRHAPTRAQHRPRSVCAASSPTRAWNARRCGTQTEGSTRSSATLARRPPQAASCASVAGWWRSRAACKGRRVVTSRIGPSDSCP